jgi:hypothetical protein
MVSWNDRSYAEGANLKELGRERQVPSRIGVRRFVVPVKRDIAYADFPIGKSPTGTKKHRH